MSGEVILGFTHKNISVQHAKEANDGPTSRLELGPILGLEFYKDSLRHAQPFIAGLSRSTMLKGVLGSNVK